MSDVTNNNFYPEDKSYVYVPDTIGPGGKSFFVTSAELIEYNDPEDGKSPNGYQLINQELQEKSLYAKIKSLSQDLHQFNQIFNGIPTFELDPIESSVDLNTPVNINIYIESATLNECRIQVKRLKKGTNNYTTFNYSCYPGQKYTITLPGVTDIGTYIYTLSATSGTKRCAKKDSPEDSPEYEYEFTMACGTAALTLPKFTNDNNKAIYSSDTDVNLSLDFYYTVSQDITKYKILVSLFNLEDQTNAITSKLYEYEGEYKAGTALQSLENFLIEKRETGNITYLLKIEAESEEIGINSKISKEFLLDFMISNSIIQTVNGLPSLLGSNESLSFNFTPKVSNSNLQHSSLKYTCYLEGKNNSGETQIFNPINREIKGQHLKSTQINFDKFINLDTDLKDYPENLVKEYELVVKCFDNLIPESNRKESRIKLQVIKQENITSDYTTQGLVLDFDFSTNPENEFFILNKVNPEENQTNTYKLKLIGGKADNFYTINEAIITSDTHLASEVDRSSYFTFRKGQGAILTDNNDNPINPLVTFEYPDKSLDFTGYTFEMFYRNNYLGDLNALAAAINHSYNNNGNQEYTIRQEGIMIPVGSAQIQYGGASADAIIRQDVWHHLAIVAKNCTKKVKINGILTPKDITQVKIYNNGILSGFSEVDRSPSISYEENPLTLNGAYNKVISTLTNSGSIDIKFLRYYCYPHEDNTIYKNYLTSFNNPEYKNIIERRNKVESTINVFFIANQKPADGEENSSKIKYYTNFETLNGLDKKKPDKDEAASSNSAVNCTMFVSYYDEDKGSTVLDPYPNVDVYLQGTSSLKYPVKNYQIKVYEKPGQKQNILPPKCDWETSSYVYTLKCDYMEQSHRNNTPTACYYQDHVLNNVIDYVQSTNYYKDYIINNKDESEENQPKNNDPYYGNHLNEYISESIARRVVNSENQPIYRDSINGIPCIVYYSDNYYNKNTTIDSGSATIETLFGDSTCAGSFMFNVDKTGDQLGFEISPNDIEIKNKQQYLKNYDGNTYIKIDSESGKINANGEILANYLPCISYEGATNENESAAAFIPYEEQRYLYLKRIWDKNINITSEGYKIFNLRQVELNNYNNWQYKLNPNDNSFLEDQSYHIVFSTFGEQEDLDKILTEEELKYTQQDNNTRVFTEVSFLSYIISKFHDTVLNLGLDNNFNRAIYGCYTLEEHKKIYGTDKYDYIQKTLEPRFSFVEELDLKKIIKGETEEEDEIIEISLDEKNAEEKEIINKMTNNIMLDAIDWVYECFKQIESPIEEIEKEGKAKFRREFNKYFSFEYCLTYFLQMMVFTQVDNAGKNAMFDTWGNGKLYPRPYDMDTQMGLDNTGFDRILVSAELNPIFSPQNLEPTITSSMQITNGASHARYDCYNTSNSALWKSFALAFEDEIKECYINLRKKQIYDLEAIQSYINSKTRDVIGETYYNLDAQNKYLNNQTYLQCLQGSREDRYYNFLKERLTFLDTYYNYNPTAGANTQILLRAKTEEGDYLIIHPVSPMYISVAIESTTTTCLITPEDTYINDAGETKKGNKFTFLASQANNKNMYINGDYNLLEIEGLNSISLEQLTLQNANNLINLNIAGASEVQTVDIKQAFNLQNINFAGCSKMGTGPITQLNLSNCPNLETLDISSTHLTKILFPEGNCNLQSLNCFKAEQLTELQLKDMPNLTQNNLVLTNTPSLHTLTLSNCNKMSNFIDDAKNQEEGREPLLPALTNLTITNCPNFKRLSLNNRDLKSLNLSFTEEGIEDLDLYGCSGQAFDFLNLRDCVNLAKLKLNYITPSNEAEIALGTKANVNIEKLDLSNSDFKTLYYTGKENTREEGTFNFDGLNFKDDAELLLNTNTKVKKINNLTYKGKLNSLFKNNSNLECIKNSDFTIGSEKSLDSMFEGCQNLQEFNETNFLLTGSSSVTNTFKKCECLKAESFENFINKLDENLDSISKLAQQAFTSVPDFTLENCKFPPGIKEAKSAFLQAGIQCIKEDLFSNCTSLTNINQIFYGNTPLTEVKDSIFSDCPLQSARSAFYGCENLTTNLIGLLNNKPDLINIAYIFAGCSSMGRNMNSEESINLNTYLNNLSKLQHATGAFYKTSILPITFEEDYILNNPQIISTAGMFAYSNLQKIPKYLYNPAETISSPANYEHAQGMFSNIVLEDAQVLDGDFFAKCSSLKNIGNHSSIPNTDDYLYTSGHKVSTAGIFGNIPGLTIKNGIFNNLSKIQDISYAFFTGKITDDDGTPKKFKDRSITDPNTSVDNDYILSFEDNSEINLFKDNSINSVNNASYLFAGNINIEELSIDLATNNLANVVNISGFLQNCIKYTGDNTFLKLMQGKPNATNMSHLFENCYSLRQDITNQELFGDKTIKLNNCSYMFKDSNIIGDISVKLFNAIKGTIKNTSYMFANCSNLTRIEQGKASNFNIPYEYDNSELHAYFNIHFKNDDETTYEDFKNNIGNYFANHQMNWYGNNLPFDRYRNYIEELLYPHIDENKEIKVIIKSENEEGQEIEEEKTLNFANGIENEYLQKFSEGKGKLLSDNGPIEIYSKYYYYTNNNIYEIEQDGLLGGCILLNNIDYMFAGCQNLKHNIPADLFASKDNIQLKQLTRLTGLFAGCCSLTLIGQQGQMSSNEKVFLETSAVSEYNTQIYDSLNNKYITLESGGNFKTIYPSAFYEQIDNEFKLQILENNNKTDAGEYLIPTDWTNAIPNIKDIEKIFYGIGNLTKSTYNSTGKLLSIDRIYPKENSNSIYSCYPSLILSNSTFNNLKIENAKEAFRSISTLTGTNLDFTFLYKSKDTLENIQYIFSNTPLNTVIQPFKETSRLKYIAYSFYGMCLSHNGGISEADSNLLTKLFKYNDKAPLNIYKANATYYLYNFDLSSSNSPPEFWTKRNINGSDKPYSLESFIKPEGGTMANNWFENNPTDPLFSFITDFKLITT